MVEDLDYVSNGEHLSDSGHIGQDYTPSLVKCINHHVKRLWERNEIDETTKKYLTLDCEVRTQRMYFLKKARKTPCQSDPLYRDALEQPRSCRQLVDYILKTALHTVDSYLRDSKRFINKI